MEMVLSESNRFEFAPDNIIIAKLLKGKTTDLLGQTKNILKDIAQRVSDWAFMQLSWTYLKNNLSPHGGVAKRFKMLTYYVCAPLFHRFALPAAGFRKAQLASWTLILILI